MPIAKMYLFDIVSAGAGDSKAFRSTPVFHLICEGYHVDRAGTIRKEYRTVLDDSRDIECMRKAEVGRLFTMV